MQDARRHAAALQEFRFERDVELGTGAPGVFPVAFHGVERRGNGAGERFFQEAGFDVGNETGAVDVEQPVAGIPAARMIRPVFVGGGGGNAAHMHSEHDVS